MTRPRHARRELVPDVHDPFLDPPARYPGCGAALAAALAVEVSAGAVVAALLSWGPLDGSTVVLFDVFVVVLALFRFRPRPPKIRRRSPAPSFDPDPGQVWIVPTSLSWEPIGDLPAEWETA